MKKAWSEARERTRQAASYAWDASLISTARMTMEVYAQIKDLDWSSVGADRQLSSWPTRLWPMDKHYHHIGGPGGFGVGYDSAGCGRRRARQPRRRTLSVNFQPDGDFDVCARRVVDCGTAQDSAAVCDAQQSRLSSGGDACVQRMSNCRDRVASLRNDMGPVGTRHRKSDHRLRQSWRVRWGCGRLVRLPTRVNSRRRCKKAVQVVKAGEPALVDVVTQPR